jgi:creatinine amidohydrolase
MDVNTVEGKNIYLALMTWPEIKDRLKETDIAIIPIGQTEQHGWHLPTSTDTIMAEGICRRVAEATYQTAKPVIAPAIPYSYSDLPCFERYPGTFTLQPETFIHLCRDVAFSLQKMGFRKLLFVNGHSPNPPFIQEAMRQITKETGALCFLGHIMHLATEETNRIHKELGIKADWGHACLMETSMVECFGGEIREDRIKGHITEPMDEGMENYYPAPPFGISYPVHQTEIVMKHIWPEDSPGPKGSPEYHSREFGERVIDSVTAPLVRLVEDLHRIRL